MNDLNKLSNKRIGLYMRKEKKSENFSTGYGRLQWLRCELGEHRGEIELYIDEYDSSSKLKELINDIRSEKIEVLMIWSVNDIEEFIFPSIAVGCYLRQISIISFCESLTGLNKVVAKYSRAF
ncbi:hypothetical protein [Clostridium gasigenes]|uniref:Resolvase, N terminal domain n=1 Tax=Clostridium gasigenes TaxID=94869 RepID=A0A1H0V3Z1_9CLOT|nr:hypothetical protein [Clostridium gasigenes]SDP73063.1 hypothetical protein SAMN04488529_11428 [Clostridium gasigenes]